MDSRIESLLSYVDYYMVRDEDSNKIIYRISPSEMLKYYENPAMSQTYLKALKKSLYQYLQVKEKGVTDKMLLGRVVDALLTGKEDDVFEEFCVVDGDIVPDINVIELMFNEFDRNTRFESIGREEMIAFIRKHNIFNRLWKDETVYDKMKTVYSDFWNSCVETGRYRIPIPISLFEKALSMVSIAKSKPIWNKLHEESDLILYQLPIYDRIGDMEFKALLDAVFIKNLDDPHITIVDIKTTNGDILDFPKIYTKLNYGFQAKFYSMMFFNKFAFDPEENRMDFGFYAITDYTACMFKAPVYSPHDQEIEMAMNIYAWYLRNGFNEDYLVAKSNYTLMADFYQEDVKHLYELEIQDYETI